MSRRLRFIPEGGALVDVTCRTIHGRYLLRPGHELNEIVLGILGRAQKRFEVRLFAFAFMSNHFHLLLWAEDAWQLSGFMNLLNSKLAREAGRLYGWRDKIWSRRYQDIVVSTEEAAQIDRLRYVLAQGCKEGLVERPRDWPGVHSAQALVAGTTLEGYWFDRTREQSARRRGEEVNRLQFAEPETVALEPLPCWSDLEPEVWRERVAALVAEIEAEAEAKRNATGVTPPGPAAIRGQRPHDHPNKIKKSAAPMFHAASKKARLELYQAYALFANAFREASEKLREGDRTVAFPPWSFPPALPFVRG
jgi:REP element-mobilizing transposase RayT